MEAAAETPQPKALEPAPEPCPDEYTLMAFVDDSSMPFHLVSAIADHVDDCYACGTFVNDALNVELDDVLARTPPPVRKELASLGFDALMVALGRKCISHQLMKAFIQDKLEFNTEGWVLAHLENCPKCMERMVYYLFLDWVKGNDRDRLAAAWSCISRRVADNFFAGRPEEENDGVEDDGGEDFAYLWKLFAQGPPPMADTAPEDAAAADAGSPVVEESPVADVPAAENAPPVNDDDTGLDRYVVDVDCALTLPAEARRVSCDWTIAVSDSPHVAITVSIIA